MDSQTIQQNTTSSNFVREPYGWLPTGEGVDRYTLGNAHGMRACISTYGCTITSLTAPDRRGRLANVVLGYPRLDDYRRGNAYLGCLIGRCAGRIGQGRFDLNGREYRLARNEGPNALHGGMQGFGQRVWKADPVRQTAGGSTLRLHHVSPAGDERYPGALSVAAEYTLTPDDVLRIDMTATSDDDTLVNLSQHTYFNLRGQGDVLDHLLQVHAGYFTPIDATQVPTGELRAVEATPFDFRQPTAVGQRIDEPDEQLRLARGYDHNWVIDAPAGVLRPHAVLSDPVSGRVVEVASTEPGLQVYSGNFLDRDPPVGARAPSHLFRGGVALEPQRFPDAPHHANFPSVVLRKACTYRHTIEYRFSTRHPASWIPGGPPHAREHTH